MANVYQQATKRRKMIYLGIIGVLFIGTLLLRGTIKLPVPGLKDTVYASSIEGRAERHELTELSQGDAELGGAAVRLLLTGSRGLAVSALWNSASEKQKKQEWNELDILVKSITKLQPHFKSPWLFQSWNLTYNVSVEMDRLNDMYFYIARGMNVLADGEARNRNSPDLRYWLGFHMQNKFGVSDKVTTLRCLVQLSCIPDEDRDPERLRNSNGTVNMEAFEKFCQANPQLIRRLKEVRIATDGSDPRPLADRPEAVIAFLETNKKLPSRYKTGTKELKERLGQFPVLPELKDQPVTTSELDWRSALPDHESDAFLVARAWFALANCAIPPPTKDPNLENVNPDPSKYRIPKRPTMIVFRQGPMRAQTYFADRLTKEGWFDKEPWDVDDFELGNVWFNRTGDDGKPVTLKLATPLSAQDAWKEAAIRWRNHGLATGLFMTPQELSRYQALSDAYIRRHPTVQKGSPPAAKTAEDDSDPDLKAQYDAQLILFNWSSNRQVTQYEKFDLEAEAMQTDDAMLAYKEFFKADRAETIYADINRAVAYFEQGFIPWKRVMSRGDCHTRQITDPGLASLCRDFRDLSSYQEFTFENNLRYVKLLAQRDQRRVKIASSAALMQASGLGGVDANVASILALSDPNRLNFITSLPFKGPFDGINEQDGRPWIPEDAKQPVFTKLGIKQAAPASPPPDQPDRMQDR